jgi:hypothetical protein
MADLTARFVFESLSSARWHVAHRTFGSSHATLIGLLVDWWVSLSPDHTALDGAPSHGKGNAGQGDVMFCRQEEPVGVLEVEGTKPLAKVESIVKYFNTERRELKSVWFGVLLLYSYAPFGRGEERQYRSAEDDGIIDAVQQATSPHPGRAIITIALDKEFSRIKSGVRSTSEYYSGTTRKVIATLFTGGKKARPIELFTPKAEPGIAADTRRE